MATYVKQSGTILLVALIFCAASSLCMLLIYETSILESTMQRHHLEKKQLFFKYLSEVNVLEKTLENHWLNELPTEVMLIQWLPDSLLCDETEGIVYYRFFHDKTLSDGVRTQFSSVFAVRGPLPKGSVHPNDKYCGVDYGTKLIPLSKSLPISKIIGEILVGVHPQGEGVLLYALASKKHHSGNVLLIFFYIAGAEPQLLKIIDTDTRLYQPLLRNNILIINDDDSVLLLDAFTGALLRNEKLESCLFTLPISENTAPIMRVQKPRELKRKILCPTSKGWTQAEIEVDYSVLGRRTWHEN